MSKQNTLTNIKILEALEISFFKKINENSHVEIDMSSDLDQMSSPWLVYRTRTVLYSSL